MARKAAKSLTRISEFYRYCRDNAHPITFAGASPYGCLGLDGYIGNLQFVSALDCVFGMDRVAFAPEKQRQAVFHTALESCNDLLRHSEVRTHITMRGEGLLWPSDADEETETLAKELGQTLALAPAKLRAALVDDESLRNLLAKAGVAFVPKIKAVLQSSKDVAELAAKAKLGSRIVVQFRDANRTKQTLIVTIPKDLETLEAQISGQTVSISTFIDHVGILVESVALSSGVFAGPLLKLHSGPGWRGASADPEAVADCRNAIHLALRKIGVALLAKGYGGVFSASFYVEKGSGKVFLRKLTPNLTPYSQLTHLLTTHYSGMPLHLFHLLAFMPVSVDADPVAHSKRWAEHDSWSIVVPYQNNGGMEFITKSPASSIYRMSSNGSAEIVAPSINPLDVQGMDECLFLRTLGTGTYRQDGLELGLILLRGDAFQDHRADRWVSEMASQTSTVQMSGTSLPVRGTEHQRVSLF